MGVEPVAATPGGGAEPGVTGKSKGLPAGLARVARWGLALLFIFAGAVKLGDPKAFAHAISQYELVPDAAIPVLALGLPLVELLAGLGLLAGARGSLSVILALLFGFIGVLGYAIAYDLDVDCGCFTVAELAARGSVKTAFFQDLAFLAAAFFVWWQQRFGGRDFEGRAL